MATNRTDELATLRWLATRDGRQTLESLCAGPRIESRTVMDLRRRWGERRAAQALAVVSIQRRAAEKFHHGILIATDRALQQATDHWIARYKSSRFPIGQPVVDVCCGIGGDMMALARRGPVVGVDADPTVCVMAAQNVSASADHETDAAGPISAAVVCDRAERLSLPSGAWLHIDPDRRPGDRRASDPHFCDPPVSVIDRLVTQSAGASIKLSPAAEIPDRWRLAATDREWISRGGVCRQQIAWILPGAGASTISATTIAPSGESQTFSVPRDAIAALHVAVAAGPRQWMLDFDPAVRASGLAAALAASLGVCAIGGPAGFFTCDHRPVMEGCSDRPIASLASLFCVLWSGAMDQRILRRMIQDFDPRSLEIKVRGVPIVPETLRPKLLKRSGRSVRSARPASDSPHPDLVLFIGRRGNQNTYAAIAQRVRS